MPRRSRRAAARSSSGSPGPDHGLSPISPSSVRSSGWGPPTLEEIRRLGAAGARQVLAVPIAFVTDHVETLYEIDQLFGAEAKAAGIASFRRTPGLNDRPTFLRALAALAESAEGFWRP